MAGAGVNYYVTFGQKYSTEPHPKVRYAHPDGWLRIEADDEDQAREIVFLELGDHWAFIYSEDNFKKNYFPRGELKTICIS